MHYLICLLLLLQPLCLWGHGHHHHDEEEPEEEVDENLVAMNDDEVKIQGIEIKIAGPATLKKIITTRGKITIHPDQLAHILPKIAGVVQEARKNVGDQVKAGEVLAIFESREVSDIKANYLAAEEKEKLAKGLFEREARLHERKITAEQDYLNAKSAYNEAKITLESAKQKMQAFGIDTKDPGSSDLRFYEIRAPIDGTVLSRHVTKGEFIAENATIYEIANLDPVWVEIGVYPNDLHLILKGQLVEVADPIGRTATARIVYLSPIIENETITTVAVAELDNHEALWRPGAFVKVNIAAGQEDVALAVPKTAIQNIDGQDYVFVPVEKGFEKKAVVLGKSDDTMVQIVSGLNAGDKYAANNTFILKADLEKSHAEHEH